MDSSMERAPGRWRRNVFIVLFLLLLALTLIPQGMKAMGRWLIVEDPLEKAPAMVVLSGHLPFRAMEGAALHRAGWAPEVWLTRGIIQDDEKRLAQMGIQVEREESYSRAVLERLGVPARSIHLFEERAQNTAEEVRLIAGELEKRREDRVIIVTSKAHSRRVRATWRSLVGKSPRAIIRYAREDPFDPETWYQYTDDALSVVREVLGNLNVWAGFPIKPKVR